MRVPCVLCWSIQGWSVCVCMLCVCCVYVHVCVCVSVHYICTQIILLFIALCHLRLFFSPVHTHTLLRPGLLLPHNISGMILLLSHFYIMLYYTCLCVYKWLCLLYSWSVPAWAAWHCDSYPSRFGIGWTCLLKLTSMYFILVCILVCAYTCPLHSLASSTLAPLSRFFFLFFLDNKSQDNE